ncbi:MAG: WG repeat-containing protein [Ignavibacteriaceae bacterium]|nr:WG repeat-containing protein [Ignavibacteriaceae bacterium]
MYKQLSLLIIFICSIGYSQTHKLIPIRDKDNNWGYADTAGNVIIEPKYSDVLFFSEGLGRVFSNVFGFIDESGNNVIPMNYEEASDFSEGYAAVKKYKGKYGLIDKPGNTVIDFIYDELRPVREGVTQGKRDGLMYLITTGGKEISQGYEFLAESYEGMVITYQKGLYGAINSKGEEVIPPMYLGLDNFANGYSWARRNDEMWGLIDKSGKTIIDFVYNFTKRDFLLYPDNHNNYYKTDNQAGTVKVSTIEGKFLFQVKADKVEWIRDDFFRYYDATSKMLGIVDIKGKIITPAKYSRIEKSKGSEFIVKSDNYFGLVDVTGAEVVPLINNEAWALNAGVFFSKDNIKISAQNEVGNYYWKEVPGYYQYSHKLKKIIDINNKFSNATDFGKGATLTPPGYSYIRHDSKAFTVINSEGKEFYKKPFELVYYKDSKTCKYGFANSYDYNEIIIEAIYDSTGYADEDMAAVKKDGKYGFVNVALVKEVIPPIYDAVTFFREGLCAVMKGKKWGYIDKNGTVKIDFEFDEAKIFVNGYAEARIGTDLYEVRPTGQKSRTGSTYGEIDPNAVPDFNGVKNLSESFTVYYYAYISDMYGVGNKKGTKSTDMDYDEPLIIEVSKSRVTIEGRTFTVYGSGYVNGNWEMYKFEMNNNNTTYTGIAFYPGRNRAMLFTSHGGYIIYATNSFTL